MVGASHDTQKEPDNLKIQESVLANHAQVWYQFAQMTKEALQIDNITGTDSWRKAINKEISKVKIAWKVNDGHTPSEDRVATANVFIGFQ